MHRLLQGDVGAGKTVVAALAAMLAIDQSWQCALMAPTEILAQQHFAKLVGWLAPLGVRVAWLTGSQKKKERTEMLALIESGEAALVVGTHAVIQEQVSSKIWRWPSLTSSTALAWHSVWPSEIRCKMPVWSRTCS